MDSHLYIVEEGQVQIFTKNKLGKRVDILTIFPGESFGEFALIDKKPRSASAQAATNCSLIRVSESGYDQLLSELPTWAQSMMKSFVFRIRHMNQIIQDIPEFVERKPQ